MSARKLAASLDQFVTFGDLLKYLRRRAGLTQRELSIAVGYSGALISRLELNQRLPDLATVAARFVPALDVENEPETAQRLLELAASVRREDSPIAGLPPYKGLLHFDESEADLFFGREALTAKLLSQLMDSFSTPGAPRFLAVVGASGSGKSSLVRAGLIATLRWAPGSVSWPVYVLTPTAHPLEALAANLLGDTGTPLAKAALADELAHDPCCLQRTLHEETQRAGAAHALLVIDQFEELYSLCRADAERKAFADNLLAAALEPAGPGVVVIALRADFYARCADHDDLREALSRHQAYIGAMTAAELRQAIEEPAQRGHWELEQGLVDVLLRDIGAEGDRTPEPGALPLLSHALLETWQRRRGATLTQSGYAASGGVRGAIAETAEAVFRDHLTQPQRVIARDVFLRLTELGETDTVPDTRRRVGLDELTNRSTDVAVVREVLTLLADARLITTEKDTAEVAHEALIREWPTLRRWLAEDRNGLRLHRHLTESAQAWQQRERDPAELYRGARLAQALEWAQFSGRDMNLNVREREFLAASQAMAEKDVAERESLRQREVEAAQQAAEASRMLAETAQQLVQAEQRRAQEQASTSRRLRRLALGLALLLLVAIGASGLAIQQSRRAERDASLARAHEWAAESVNQLEIDPERSVWLALYALDEARAAGEAELPQAEEALHLAVQAVRVLLTLPHEYPVLRVRFNADGTRLVTVDDHAVVRIWDLTVPDPARQAVFQFSLPRIDATAPIPALGPIELSADGAQIAFGDNQVVTIWDVATGQLQHTLVGKPNDPIANLAFSPDGGRLAVSSKVAVTIWDTVMGDALRLLPSETLPISQIAFSPDGARLVIASDTDGYTVVYDIETGQKIVRLWDGPGIPYSVSYSPTGQYVATGDNTGTVRLWDVDTGGLMLAYESAQTTALAFSPDGRQLAAGSTVWETGADRKLFGLEGHTNFVAGLAYSPDGTRLATASADHTVKVWDATPMHEWLTLRSPAGLDSEYLAVEFSPANEPGQLLLAAGAQDTWPGALTGSVFFRAMVWDVVQGRRLWQTQLGGQPVGLSFSPTGTQLAVTETGLITLRSVAAGVKRETLPAIEWPSGVAYYPDGTRVAYVSCGGQFLVWDLMKREVAFRDEMTEIPEQCGWMVRIRVSLDGRLLAVAGPDQQVRLFDAQSGKLLHTLSGHQETVRGLALSADGRLLAAGSDDATITVWDTASATLLYRLTGHNTGIPGLAFSPDGKLLASSDWGGLTKLWDLDRREERLTLYNESGAYSVAFSPDGKFLAVAGDEIRIFLPRLDDLVALARERLTRTLSTEECQQYLRLATCPTLAAWSQTE